MELHDGYQPSVGYDITSPAAHTLHTSSGPHDFCQRFSQFTDRTVEHAVDRLVRTNSPKAVLLTGSIPLRMATHGSDVDLIVLVDDRNSLIVDNTSTVHNNHLRLSFSNDTDPLRAGLFLTVMKGVTVEVAVVLAPAVKAIQRRLRNKGPELTQSEIMTLGRLRTGWLLWQSEDYLQRAGISLHDRSVDIYCSTMHFSYSLIYRLKATRALQLGDIAQALHLGRTSVETAYLAYFASEEMPYLGAKWLAQIGHAEGADARKQRHPLLGTGLPLLFPAFTTERGEATEYLRSVGGFLNSMKSLIEENTLFRIAFKACPQIYCI